MLDLAHSAIAELAVTTLSVCGRLQDLRLGALDSDKINRVNGWLAQYLTVSTLADASQWVHQHLTWSTLLNVVFIILLAANFKNLPLVYHLRILNAVRFVLKSQRPPKPLNPEQLFKPLITSSRATLMETDVLGHKSNSTYFSDVDVARTHLITTLFSTAIEKIRGSTTMNSLSGKARSAFTVPLGGVSCSFSRELKPYEKYDMWTRILAWDEKWLYIITHFVKGGAKIVPREYTLYPRQNSTTSSSKTFHQSSMANLNTARGSKGGQESLHTPNSAIAASMLSKVVFKNGRITIAPEMMLEAAGLLPPKPTGTEAEHSSSLAHAQILANGSGVRAQEAISQVEKIQGCDSSSHSSHRGSMEGLKQGCMRESIEAKRRRGMKSARLLGDQVALVHEFNDQVALGRHYDGYGVEGVVATLAQLCKLSNYQLL